MRFEHFEMTVNRIFIQSDNKIMSIPLGIDGIFGSANHVEVMATSNERGIINRTEHMETTAHEDFTQ